MATDTAPKTEESRLIRQRRWLVSITPIALLLVATLLRFRGLFIVHAHPDEAIFATWARMIGTWQAPLLQGELVDKPPLLFYLQGSLYPLLGTPAIWVSRLPNLVASILIVPVTLRFARDLYRDRLTTVVTAMLATFSPLLVAFSSTSFTDPLMTALVMGALLAFRRSSPGDSGASASKGDDRSEFRRTFGAGLLMGLAVATKYQALLFVPLQIGLGCFHGHPARLWRSWLAGFSVPLLCLFGWSLARDGMPGIWGLQAENYGGLRLAWSWELWPRLEAWGELWGSLLNAPVLAFALILASPVFLALLIQRQDRHTALDQMLLIFLLVYVTMHWFVAVPIWDRYLVPVAPLAITLLGRFVSRVVSFVAPEIPLQKRWLHAGPVMLILTLVAGPVIADQDAGASAIHSQDGPAAVAGELADAPYGAVLYDHWFSWELRYALMDGKVYLSWFAHPEALVADLDAFLGHGPARYVVLPRGPAAIPVIRALGDASYSLQTVRVFPRLILYEVRE